MVRLIFKCSLDSQKKRQTRDDDLLLLFLLISHSVRSMNSASLVPNVLGVYFLFMHLPSFVLYDYLYECFLFFFFSNKRILLIDISRFSQETDHYPFIKTNNFRRDSSACLIDIFIRDYLEEKLLI